MAAFEGHAIELLRLQSADAVEKVPLAVMAQS
jgi:hypothetical protein